MSLKKYVYLLFISVEHIYKFKIGRKTYRNYIPVLHLSDLSIALNKMPKSLKSTINYR